MKKLLFALLVFSYSCKDDVTPESIDPSGESKFVFFDDIDVNDMLLSSDQSLFAVGNKDLSSDQTPFIARFTDKKELHWLREQNLGGPDFFKRMRIFRTSDANNLMLTDSKPIGSNSSTELRKFDHETGALFWKSSLGLVDEEDEGIGVVETMNGDFLVSSRIHNSILPAREIMLTRVSASGENLWQKRFEVDSFLYMSEMIHFPEDGTVMMLFVNGTDAFNENDVEIKIFNEEGELISFDNIIVKASIGIAPIKMIKTNEDQILLGFKDHNAPGDPIRLIKFDKDLEMIWDNEFSHLGSETLKNIIQTESGAFYVVSTVWGSGDQTDFALTKINSGGNSVEWRKIYGTSRSDRPLKLVEKSNGDIVIAGKSYFETLESSDYQMFLFQTDSEGIPK